MVSSDRPGGLSQQEWVEIRKSFSIDDGSVSEVDLLTGGRRNEDPSTFVFPTVRNPTFIEEMKVAFDSLTPEEKFVIEEKFGLVTGVPKAESRIAESLDKSEDEVKAILSAGLRKLRHPGQ